MARQNSFPSYSRIWNQYVSIYQLAFTRSLQKLALEKRSWRDEPEVTEFLASLLNTACFELRPEFPEEDIRTPFWEGSLQPRSKEELTGGKKQKRPDFTCNIYNPHAESPELSEIPLHIECKLLGEPTSPTWILNRNYVTDGIRRFDSSTHGYGKRATTGMMVGYVISMTPPQILSEVNSHLETHCNHLSALQFKFGSKVVECLQIVQRKVVEPINFELIHIWVDLR